MRVEDGFANETEGAMSDFHSFLETLGSDARDASHHLDLFVVAFFGACKDHFWRVDLPSPGCTYGIGAVAPAKDAFIAARKRGSGFHAQMRFDAIEAVFVAGASTTQCRFRPAADLYAGMGANDCIALLRERSVGERRDRDHGFWSLEVGQ